MTGACFHPQLECVNYIRVAKQNPWIETKLPTRSPWMGHWITSVWNPLKIPDDHFSHDTYLKLRYLKPRSINKWEWCLFVFRYIVFRTKPNGRNILSCESVKCVPVPAFGCIQKFCLCHTERGDAKRVVCWLGFLYETECSDFANSQLEKLRSFGFSLKKYKVI